MLFALGACSGDTADVQSANLDQVFDASEHSAPLYSAPASSTGLYGNFLAHVRNGTKDQHRFATQMLLDGGAQAADVVANQLEKSRGDSFTIGFAVSCCQVLSDIGNESHAQTVIAFTDLKYPPIVRTAAFQCLAQIGGPELGPKLVAAFAQETEASPRDACLNAIAQTGSDAGMKFTVSLVENWLANANQELQSSWNALLLCSNKNLASELAALHPQLPPYQALQAMGVRMSLNERDLVNEVAQYLDADKYPSGGTRSLAVQLLAELGQWQKIIDAAPAHNEKVDSAIVSAFGRDDAPQEAKALLDLYSQSELDSIRRQALTILVAMSKLSYLDSDIRNLQDYPFTSESLVSLSLLTDLPKMPAHVAAVMIERFDSCDEEDHMNSLVRAMVRSEQPAACDFLGQAMIENRYSERITAFISQVLGNIGPGSIKWFMKLWQQQASLANAQVVFSALSRFGDNVEVQKLFVDTANSAQSLPEVRMYVFNLIRKVYPYKAQSWFLNWRDEATHSGVRAYLNKVLTLYY